MAVEAQNILDSADLLYNHQQIDAALDEVADQLTAALGEQTPVLMCVMNGGLMTFSTLVSKLHFPLQMDYIHATRYRDSTEGKEVKWLAEPRYDLKGRHVVIVDDILDEGVTLEAIIQYCKEAGAESVSTVMLVHKQHDRCITGVKADYVGLNVPDRYVFGFGMDYKGFLRNIPAIYAVSD
nr:hypoxanthine-guanine phosphoribosyltransferase [Marinibactrum halimedae]